MFTAALMAGAMMLSASGQAPVSLGQALDDPATVIDDVEVTAHPLRSQVTSFLDEISLPEVSLKVARWQDQVCVGVVNIRGQSAQLIADRVSQVAVNLGLNAGEPGCRPNIMIFGVPDGAAFAAGMVELRPRVFNPGGQGMVRTQRSLERFKTTDAAIRWWHVAEPVDGRSGRRASRLPGEDAPQVSGRASRLTTEIRNDLAFAVIILDLSKLEGLNLRQISDFTAMVAFSQIDLDADFAGYDSILSLMENSTVAGLTEWDQAYLQALYTARLSQLHKGQQQGEIARLMAQRRREQSEAEAASAPD